MGARHQLGILIGTTDDLEAERHALVLQERQRDRRHAKSEAGTLKAGSPVQVSPTGAAPVAARVTNPSKRPLASA